MKDRLEQPASWMVYHFCRKCGAEVTAGPVLVDYDERVQIEHETCPEDE